MKKFVLFILVLSAFSSFAKASKKAEEMPEISSFEKTIICRAVIKDYADELDSEDSKEQLINCRTKGIFSSYPDESYGIILRIESGSLRCQAEINEPALGRKTPFATLENCNVVEPKPRMGGSN